MFSTANLVDKSEMGYCLCDSPTKAYLEMVKGVKTQGRETAPRQMPTLELPRIFTLIRNPMERLVLVPGRCMNPFFLVAEAIWILSGSSDSEYILQFNKRLGNFLDEDSTHFHGAYGERIRCHYYSGRFRRYHLNPREDSICETDQVATVVKRLLEDPDTRRAVIVLWDPYLDNGESNDIPCNDMVFFKVRDGKLNMTVLNRSNDIILGFPVTNTFQFSMLQELIAILVDVEVGTYMQYSDSLHLYKDDPIAKRMLKVVYPEWYVPPIVSFKRIALKGNLAIFDVVFKDLMALTSKQSFESIEESEFLGQCPVLRDYAYYLLSFLCYREKLYEKALSALEKVADFNLFLAGIEFYMRAIKGSNVELVKPLYDKQLLDRIAETFGVNAVDYYKSAMFFVEGWRHSNE